MVKVNETVSVEVLDIDRDKQRLSLGLKQTQKDPWLEKIKKYKIKDVVQGKVTRIVKFGLFVQIEPGVEGLVHISELSVDPVRRPSEIAKIGDEIIIRIIDIDFDKRRMAFSIRQVEHSELAEEKKMREEEKKRADQTLQKDRKPIKIKVEKKEGTKESEEKKEAEKIEKEVGQETEKVKDMKEFKESKTAQEVEASVDEKSIKKSGTADETRTGEETITVNEAEIVEEPKPDIDSIVAGKDLGNISQEEKKETIKKLLEEMKHEAHLE